MTPSVRKHPRTTREAWQRPPARQTTFTGPYVRPPGRLARAAHWLALLAAFAAIGAMLGWGF